MNDYEYIQLKDRVCFAGFMHNLRGLDDDVFDHKSKPKCLGPECSNYEPCLKEIIKACDEIDTLLAKIPAPDQKSPPAAELPVAKPTRKRRKKKLPDATAEKQQLPEKGGD